MSMGRTISGPGISDMKLTPDGYEDVLKKIDFHLGEVMRNYSQNHCLGQNSIPFIMAQKHRDEIRGIIHQARQDAYYGAWLGQPEDKEGDDS